MVQPSAPMIIIEIIDKAISLLSDPLVIKNPRPCFAEIISAERRIIQAVLRAALMPAIIAGTAEGNTISVKRYSFPAWNISPTEWYMAGTMEMPV